MSIYNEIFDSLMKLDAKRFGGFSEKTIVSSKAFFSKELRSGRFIYFREPNPTYFMRVLDTTSIRLFNLVNNYCILENNYTMDENSQVKLKELIRNSLQALFYYDKKNSIHRDLKGMFSKHASMPYLKPSSSPYIDREEEIQNIDYESYIIEYRGCANYIVKIRLHI